MYIYKVSPLAYYTLVLYHVVSNSVKQQQRFTSTVASVSVIFSASDVSNCVSVACAAVRTLPCTPSPYIPTNT